MDPLSLLFEDCKQKACVDILIHNDYTLEDLIEVLTVSLEAVPDLSDRIILNPAESRVLIIDDDGNVALYITSDMLIIILFSASHQC